MCHALRFAFAAAQAMLDGIIQITQFAGFKDNSFLLQQAQRWRVGPVQVGMLAQFALVEVIMRVDSALVFSEGIQFFCFEVLNLGNADTMFTRDCAVQRKCQPHDLVHDTVCLLQHGIVIRVHGDIGMHIAITGVHVQGYKQS